MYSEFNPFRHVNLLHIFFRHKGSILWSRRKGNCWTTDVVFVRFLCIFDYSLAMITRQKQKIVQIDEKEEIIKLDVRRLKFKEHIHAFDIRRRK